MYTIDGYISSIKMNFDKQNDQVSESLYVLFKRTFTDEIELLDFTVFIEPTRFECSVSVFAMDRNANEVLSDSTGTGHFYGSQEIAAEIEYFKLPDNKRTKFEQFYMENEEELMSLELKVLTDWFQENWEKAGGRSLALPSYLILHDGYSSYDLKQNRWVGDGEKWG